MIPSSDIFDDIADESGFFTADSKPDEKQAGELVSVYQFLAGQIDIWKDPYFLLKQKCPPKHPPSSVCTLEIPLRYVCTPFPLSKIHSVSFERSTMSSFIIDETGRLLQLLYETESENNLREGLEYICVIEYLTPLGVFLARKVVQ